MRKLLVSFILIFTLAGSAEGGWFWGKDYLAKINGNIIDLEDFQSRLDELHRKRSMQRHESMPTQIDLRKTLDDMINDYIFYLEGVRLGLDKEPEFIRRINSYLEFRSILRLRKEEVKDKVGVKEGEIKGFYEKQYRSLKSEGKTPPDYQKVKKKIRHKIYKKKEREREREYLNRLKEIAKIEIDYGLLGSAGQREKNINEAVALVDGKPITVRDLMKECGKSLIGKEEEEAKEIKRKALEGLIEYLLIKEDALNHNYPQKDPSFKKMIAQYRIILMAGLFGKLIISPQVKISEEDLEQYYDRNREKFREKGRVKLAIIKAKSRKQAISLFEELKAGADFNRLARLCSKDNSKEKWGGPAWWSFENLPSKIKRAVKEMKPGDVSSVIEAPPYFQMVKLVSLEEGIKEFSAVKGMIRTTLGRKRYRSLLNKYLLKMKKYLSIKVNEDLLENFKKKVENVP